MNGIFSHIASPFYPRLLLVRVNSLSIAELVVLHGRRPLDYIVGETLEEPRGNDLGFRIYFVYSSKISYKILPLKLVGSKIFLVL